MISLTKILQEMSKYEYLSKGLNQLYNKYKDHPDKNKLYVNFSDSASDPIMKAPIWQPKGHQDPVGIYAYPLDFVLIMINKIPYAGERKYIRILKNKSKSTLVLSDMVESIPGTLSMLRAYPSGGITGGTEDKKKMEKNAEDIIKKNKVLIPLIEIGMTPKDIFTVFSKFWHIRIKGGNWLGKLFFQCVQWDLKGNNVRSPIEQTRLLRKMGYDAIEDESEDEDEAVINPNEPSQIIFLARDSFDVIEIIEQGVKKEESIFPRIVKGIVDHFKPKKYFIGRRPIIKHKEQRYYKALLNMGILLYLWETPGGSEAEIQWEFCLKPKSIKNVFPEFQIVDILKKLFENKTGKRVDVNWSDLSLIALGFSSPPSVIDLEYIIGDIEIEGKISLEHAGNIQDATNKLITEIRKILEAPRGIRAILWEGYKGKSETKIIEGSIKDFIENDYDNPFNQKVIDYINEQSA